MVRPHCTGRSTSLLVYVLFTIDVTYNIIYDVNAFHLLFQIQSDLVAIGYECCTLSVKKKSAKSG